MEFFSRLTLLLELIGAVWAPFLCLHSTLRPKTRIKMSRWLQGTIPVRINDRWPSTFVDAFDALFGDRLLSVRFAFVSVVSSLVFSTFLLLVWCTLCPDEVWRYFMKNLYNAPRLYILLVLLVNVIPDSLSNCQSRYILGRLICSLESTKSQSDFRIYLKWLSLDFFLTVTISSVIIIPISFLVYDLLYSKSGMFGLNIIIGDPFDLLAFLSLHSTEIVIKVSDDAHSGNYKNLLPPYGVFFYTTFLTSIWLWLYSVSGSFVAVLHRSLGSNSCIVKFLVYKCHPLPALGGVCAFLVAIVYLLVLLFV